MAILRKPYEISVWEDILVAEHEENGEVIPSHYQENRIMVIGSDEMTSPNKAISPVLTKNINGEVTFTFSMAYKYFDPLSNAEVINPFIGYLINERKIKLHYPLDDPDAWYDLIIVDHQEDSETMVWQYTAKDAFVNELSKNGYAIEFNTELGNNQGTAVELAKTTLKNTDWTVDEEGSDTLVQKVNEPMVRATLLNGNLTVYNVNTKENNVVINSGEELYVFYSYIANKEINFVQFMRASDESTFTFDDNNSIIGTNYRILDEVRYTIVNDKVTGFDVQGARVSLVTSIDGGPQYTTNQGYRIVYGPLTTYDPVMERTVERYTAPNATTPSEPYEIYKYTDSDYTTSNVIMPLVTNGSNFDVYGNGIPQGWSNANITTTKDESGKNKFQHLSLTSYPELGVGKSLIPLTTLSRIQGYLELKFEGILNSNYENTYFNSGFMDNASTIDHISRGQEFVFRIACAKATQQHGDLTPIINNENSAGVRAMVAYYTEPNGTQGYLTKDYYRQIASKDDIILQFDGTWTLDNPTIIGGTFSTDEQGQVDYRNYIINNVVQEPTTNSVYKVNGSNTEYVWDTKLSKYVQKTSSNFVDYYRTITSARIPVTNTKMTDPKVRIGIFLYTTDSALCESDVYTYISDVQITKCVYDANQQPITIGNIPTTTTTDTSTYYIKPKDGATKEGVDTYYDLNGLARFIGCNVSDIVPIYNSESEKILSISESQSNCFNILQTICETFECWLNIKVEHDSRGAVIPGTKQIQLKEFAGKDNFAGFKYAINLKSIQRTLNSEEIVTKLIVDNVQSDYVDEGVMSIRNATANPSGEAYIINLNYYINKGLIKNGQDCQDDINQYYAHMKALNNQLNEKRAAQAQLELALNKLNSDRNVYTELLDTAAETYNKGMVKFEEATGMNYNDYVEKYGFVASITDLTPLLPSEMDTGGRKVNTDDPTPVSTWTKTYTSQGYGFGIYNGKVYGADQYTASIRGLGWLSWDDTYVSRLRRFDDGVWVTIWSDKNRQGVTTPTDPEQLAAWNVAWANRGGDHGATAVQNASLNLRLSNYGYGQYDIYDYLAIELVSQQDANIKRYRLYRWDEESMSWLEQLDTDTEPNQDPTYGLAWQNAWRNRGYSRHGETTLRGGDLTQHEEILEIIAELYTASSTINNYSGILTNLNQEYDKLKLQVYGAVDYTITLSSNDLPDENQNIYRYSRVLLSDYIDGTDSFDFYFHKNDGNEDNRIYYNSSVSIKSFEASDLPSQWYSHIKITSIPKHYSLINNQSQTISINENIALPERASVNYKLVADQDYKNAYPGLKGEIEELQKQKDEYEKQFYTKYSHYIKEGTWSSNEYVDANLYYLDALQTSANSAMPKVEYSIDVAEVSELENLNNYVFDVGDKTYIEDTEFFGWNAYYVNKTTREITHVAPAPSEFNQYESYIRPAREEIIVSQVEWHLDEPETNVITVQNYKTRFEDLFQRLSATVQTVQYNEATYAKMTSLLDANGTINQNVLLASLNGISGSTYALTTDGSITIESDQITIRDLKNLTNSQNVVKIDSRGISVSSDAGVTWTTALDGTGLNAGIVTSGELNTHQIVLLDGDNPSFRWDKYGISAYKSRGSDQPYDLNTYVRFDQYGLYGVQKGENYHATSLADVKDKAQFGLTWDGFFIKNSYTGGGLVQITSDNDFQVINSDQTEKIKIGALEWVNASGQTVTTPIDGVAPSLYGIRINNNAGQTVFKTGDDGNLTITGTINAAAGNIGGMTVNQNTLRMNHTIFERGVGIYSDLLLPNNEPMFTISDVNGNAIFNNITARGHIEAQTGTLGDLDVIDTITVGANGAIESSNWSESNKTGWHIDDTSATFNNANVRGTITALQGDFLGAVRVGPTDQNQDHIIIDGTRALIKSSNYQDGAGYGWMINKDGDAVFNNITARGAIKTAVFEYAEIQAVGGIFIFRPSSTIRDARRVGETDDIQITVEKPFLFSVGDWCKISNYTNEMGEPEATAILSNNGLTHVYKIKSIDATNSRILILENAYTALTSGQTKVVNDITDIIGGALVDMGNKVNGDGIPGTNNYGIGINSSDNTVNLPARAISLFETVVDETKSPKVSYRYRGILGTLPQMNSSSVNTTIYNNMAGTQGIYTDNMYIGDKNQYIAFYTDGNGDKHLKINARDMVFSVAQDGTEKTWEERINEIEIEGGESSIDINIISSNGNVFLNGNISTRLTCQIILGGSQDITSDYHSFTWKKTDKDGILDNSWTKVTTVPYIDITGNDVTSKATFSCEVDIQGE